MTAKDKWLDSVREHRFIQQFRSADMPGILIWVADRNDVIIDITAGVARYFNSTVDEMLGRSAHEFAPPEHHERLHDEVRRILATRRSVNSVRWIRLPSGWRKFVSTRAPLGNEYVITVSHDITDKEPANHWLLQLDLINRRLSLGERYNNQYLKLPELLILHRLVRGLSYREIADEFNISLPTVKYRLARIKEALGVGNMVDLWSEIFAGGLVHLLALPLGLDKMPKTAEDLFRLDAGTD